MGEVIPFAAPGRGGQAAPFDASAPRRRHREPPSIDLDTIGEFGRLSAQLRALDEASLPDDAQVSVRCGGRWRVMTGRQIAALAFDLLEEREDVLRPFDHREHMRMGAVVRRSVRLSRE